MQPSATFRITGDKLPDDVSPRRFEAREAISEPYAVEVAFVTKDDAFHVEDCLRTRLCFVVTAPDGEERHFDGVVDRARFVGVTSAERLFEVRLVPALAALEHRRTSRIFQDRTIVQVVQTVFTEAGFADKVEWRQTKEYEPREFIVQYQETHLNFVSRLLEDNGLFYFFLHDADGHKLVVCDDATCFGASGEAAAVVLSMGQGAAASTPLAALRRTRRLRPNSVTLRDYDFERPATPPTSNLPTTEAADLPYFEYPGGFTEGAAGERRANARLRSLRGDSDVCEGESRAMGLRVGVPFVVAGAAEPCLEGELVITSLVSSGKQSLHAGAVNVAVENRFQAIPKGAPFAAPRRAHRPRIRGIQTAVVTGSSQQEQAIHVDKYGRIKVRFHWDRQGQLDHTSSCWLRVSQAMMGGSIVLPRVSWEVSVAFLDGDPDRPIALGRVYNAEKTPPLSLPASKASASLKSMSSPGAGGHNEIGMSDSGGSQGFGIHAQKDYNATIGHDKVEEVKVDEEQTVTCNVSNTVGVDDSVSVTGDQSLDVGAVLSHKITGNQTIVVGGNDTSNAISNYVEKVDGSRSYAVTGNQTTIQNGIAQSVTGNFTRKVGSLELVGSVGSINDNILGSLNEDVGAVKVQLVNGSVGEMVAGSKNETYVAAQLHMTKAALTANAAGTVTHMIGGLHYQKLAGDYVVKAPMITLLGGVGVFKGGGSELKLGGGPVVGKGTTITVKSSMIVKLGASMKLGS